MRLALSARTQGDGPVECLAGDEALGEVAGERNGRDHVAELPLPGQVDQSVAKHHRRRTTLGTTIPT